MLFPSHVACPLVFQNLSADAAGIQMIMKGSEKHGTKPKNDEHKPCSSKALILPVCVLSCCLRYKKQYSFQLSYTETETLESGLAKLMCRKALGVNSQ